MSIKSFREAKIIEPILRALDESGYTDPTPIQTQAIPILLDGFDLLGCAQTGTGKTAAFAIPILQKLNETKNYSSAKHTRCLVLVPTRELAVQVHDSFLTYGKYLNLKSAVMFGGVGQNPQVRAIAQGLDILVATPGRLLDLINQGFVKLAKIEFLVLDEADRMLDMGFIHDIKKILSLIPPKRHNLFFSATMPPIIEKLANSILNHPKRIEVTPVSSTVEIISQSVMFVETENKRLLLKHVLGDKSVTRAIVFSRTKHGANKISDFLEGFGIFCSTIHGNKSQSARQNALENFRMGKTKVLIATDIAARGIDIDGISHVINFDLPNESESYVHRIGRTARAGASGTAISFCDAHEKAFLKDIEKLIGKPIDQNLTHPFHSENVINARLMSSGKAKTIIDGRGNPRNNSRGKPREERSGNRFSSQRKNKR